MKFENVVHHRKAAFDVYIGRKCIGRDRSKWANPFRIGVDGNLSEVLEMYEKHILETPRLFHALYELKGKVLGCWCRPRKCHGDILQKLINEHVKES